MHGIKHGMIHRPTLLMTKSLEEDRAALKLFRGGTLAPLTNIAPTTIIDVARPSASGLKLIAMRLEVPQRQFQAGDSWLGERKRVAELHGSQSVTDEFRQSAAPGELSKQGQYEALAPGSRVSRDFDE
jgi:hypothetical protein